MSATGETISFGQDSKPLFRERDATRCRPSSTAGRTTTSPGGATRSWPCWATARCRATAPGRRSRSRVFEEWVAAEKLA